MEKLFFVPEGDGATVWGDTVDEIFDELEQNSIVSDVFTWGYLVDTSTMTVKRVEFSN